jgi:outer membrane protein TolC
VRRVTTILFALIGAAALATEDAPWPSSVKGDATSLGLQSGEPSREPAVETPPLTLAEVLSSVDRQYPPLLGAELDREAAEGELTASWGAFDLNWKNRFTSDVLGYYQNYRFDSVLEKPLTTWGMNVFGGYRIGRGEFPVYNGKLFTLSGGEARAGFEISLWRNRSVDRRRANLDKSRRGVTIAEANKIQARIEAVRMATQRYWDWVAAGRRVAIFRELLSIAQLRDQAMRERVKHGDLPEFERKDNERTILQRQAQLVAAKRSLEQSAIELSLFYRDEAGNPQLPQESRLPREIPRQREFQFPVSVDTERALLQRPELARLAASREQNVIEERWADNQLAPQLDLQVAASHDLGEGPVTNRGPELEASVFLAIPLERRFAAGRRESARATAARLEAMERMMRDRIAADVRDAHSWIDAAWARIDIATAETELAKRLEQGERARFEHGDSNILFVNLREQATADARVREVEALADYQKGLAQLKAATADP